MRTIFYTVSLLLLFSGTTLFAGNDPSIKGKLRRNIQKTMNRHIQNHLVEKKYIIFDGKKGKVLKLWFQKLHKGIVKKGSYYVSCADFTDKSGKKYDLDFLVIKKRGRLKVVQSLIHSVNSAKRSYQVE